MRTTSMVAGAAVFLIALAALVSPTAHAQQPTLTGDVPTNGGVALVTYSGGSVQGVATAAATEGCSLVSVWSTSGGEMIGHIVGAPDFVNTEFAGLYPSDIPPATPLLIVCASGSGPGPSPTPSATPGAGAARLLVLDEDAIDNGLFYRLNPTLGSQNIFPDNPTQFSAAEVNDNRAAEGLRDPLSFFSSRVGQEVSLLSGQTGDEGWFAISCVPARWLPGDSGDECLSGAERTQAMDAFRAGSISQDNLDEVPDVRPLRARGLTELEGQTVCAVVYDSDVSVNYEDSSPFTEGNLQGENYGIVAFTVLDVVRLAQFSSSSLPEVQVRIADAGQACANLAVFDAPIPPSSSEPEDIDPASPSSGYR